MEKKPLVLAILDGFGISENSDGNAISMAKTPVLDNLIKTYPNTKISGSGEDVGLPDGQMGNSEVGHTNIGAGRIVYQELTRITKSIKDGDFFKNEVLVSAIDSAVKNDKSVHIMGLLSDGGVHSHINHLFAVMELAKKEGVKNLFIHPFLDGRDTSPTSGAGFLSELENKIDELSLGEIATVSGRYYAMDRDKRWERVEKTYDAFTKAIPMPYENKKASEIVSNLYKEDITDEFVVPFALTDKGVVKEDDTVIFFNFRPDRARQLTRAFVDTEFDGFARENGAMKLNYVCMTQYDETMPNVSVAFKPTEIHNTLGEVLSNHGKTQLRIAETEKYAHVTFFFNGGNEKVYDGEERILVHSPKVATYDKQPEMSAYEVTEKLLSAIENDRFDVVILNFANCDMVGHTGSVPATIKAVETVDECIGKIANLVLKKHGSMIITADHGNAEKMYADDGSPFTAHTTNLVPMILVSEKEGLKLKESGGRLSDLAPTMLDILGIEKPHEMTGKSLLK